MRLIAHIYKILLQSGIGHGLDYLAVGLSYELDPQSFAKLLAGLAFLCQNIPKHCRVSVCRKESRMCYGEFR